MTKEQSEITPKTTPPPSGNGNNGNEWAANAIQFQRERLVGEVADANLLLEFGLANGKPIPDELIAELAVQPANGNGKRGPDPPDGFQTAYRDLVQFLAPVTAASLRATDDQHGRNVRLWAPGQRSAGKLWSRKLWLWTIAFAVFVVFSENYQRLLDRTFDTLRIPEYYNRMRLGIVSGGAVKLFVDQAGGAGGAVELSSPVLAFVAGYNCDFLFSAIERVIATILPKVHVERAAPKAPAQLAGVNLENLLAQYEGASADGKRVIEGLVEKLKDRL